VNKKRIDGNAGTGELMLSQKEKGDKDSPTDYKRKKRRS